MGPKTIVPGHYLRVNPIHIRINFITYKFKLKNKNKEPQNRDKINAA